MAAYYYSNPDSLVDASLNLEQQISRPKIVRLRYMRVFANESLSAQVISVQSVQHCMPEEGPMGPKHCI